MRGRKFVDSEGVERRDIYIERENMRAGTYSDFRHKIPVWLRLMTL
jgi:hypothetical protein